ncbi:MAG: methyltransferase domain-containing protein [Candidatus Hodarchaeales archaeon]|jgi:2-polyprenyl-3-methyl-5-hydroxy-6-metoxy-1,4-benzoquinol methylase
MLNKIIGIFWKLLKKPPRLKEALSRFYAWRIFEIVPTLKKIIYKLYDKFWYLELYLDSNEQNITKILQNNLEIDIKRLNHYVKYPVYSINRNLRLEKDWDASSNLEKINESNQFRIIKKHFLEKVDWKEIDLYHKFNVDQLTKVFSTLDELFHNFDLDKVKSKIRVGIGSKGEFLLIEGLFYLSLLKILEINTIPIEIIIRHPQWTKFCNEFLKFKSIHGGIYQPLIHPDLNIETYDSNSEERFKIIKDNLDKNRGSLLDIGANLGFFCHKFEDIGFNCYAVEIRPSNVYFMKKLRDIEGKEFKIINKSIFELKDSKQFEVVIALNIFHHFLREKELYFKLIEFLKNLKVNVLFFQPHDPNEDIMRNAYINYNNRQFVDFLIKFSCLNRFVLLNEKVDGKNRPIYKLIK